MTNDVLDQYRLDSALTEEEKHLLSICLSKEGKKIFADAGIIFTENQGDYFCQLTEPNEQINQLIFLFVNLATQFNKSTELQEKSLEIPAWIWALRLALVAWSCKDEKTLICLNNLAFCLDSLGRSDEALPHYQAALSLKTEALGPRHPQTLTSLNNLASCLDSLGRSDEALPHHQAALSLSTEVLGPRHPQTLTSLNNLAGCLDRLGRSDEALPHYQAALSLSTEVLGPRHPDTLTSRNNLASCLGRLGQSDEALPHFEAALSLRTEVLGPRHPQTLTSLNNLAGCLDRLGRSDEALPHYQAALSLKTEVLGPRHPDTLTSLNNLASCLDSLGRSDEALPHLEAALSLSTEVLGPRHLQTLASLNNLAFCLDKQSGPISQPQEACEQLAEAAYAHIKTPWRYQAWFTAIPKIAKCLTRHVNAGRYTDWHDMFDQLSNALTETLEIQVEQTIDHAYQCSADFHACYLRLCLQQDYEAHIPTILARIHAPKLAALVWDQLTDYSPEHLGDVEREFLAVRRQLVQQRLIDPRRTEEREKQNPEERSASPMDAEHAAALEQQRFGSAAQHHMIQLLDRYRHLRDQLGASFHTLIHPDANHWMARLRTRLQPGHALLLLIDIPTSDAFAIPPFALLLRYDCETWHVIPELPKLAQLAQLFAYSQQYTGQRSGYRRANEQVAVNLSGTATRSCDPDLQSEDALAQQSSLTRYVEQAKWIACLSAKLDHWHAFLDLSAALREPHALEAPAVSEWQNSVIALSGQVNHIRKSFAQDGQNATTQQKLEACILAAEKLTQSFPDMHRAEQASLMSHHLWQPLQTALGGMLDNIDHLYWVTHGSLHTLPYDLNQPDDFPNHLYHYPGTLFLNTLFAASPSSPTDPCLIHAYHAPRDHHHDNHPIPFVLTDEAIAKRFLSEPHIDLLTVSASNHQQLHMHEGLLSGHGDSRGNFQAGTGQIVSWQNWIAHNCNLRHAYISTCLLGRTHERHGDPMGWVSALLLQRSETVIAALAPISDFYAPLLNLLFYQSRYYARHRRPHPEEALREAKQRLRQGNWYQADDLVAGHQQDTTAALIQQLYPIGMEATLDMIRHNHLPVEQLARWYLPDSWQSYINRPSSQLSSERKKQTVNQSGQQLIQDTLDMMIQNPVDIGHQPEVEALISAVVCFGKTSEKSC